MITALPILAESPLGEEPEGGWGRPSVPPGSTEKAPLCCGALPRKLLSDKSGMLREPQTLRIPPQNGLIHFTRPSPPWGWGWVTLFSETICFKEGSNFDLKARHFIHQTLTNLHSSVTPIDCNKATEVVRSLPRIADGETQKAPVNHQENFGVRSAEVAEA